MSDTKSLRSKELCDSSCASGVSHNGPKVVSGSSVMKSNLSIKSANKSKTQPKNGIVNGKSLRSKDLCESLSTNSVSRDGPSLTSGSSLNKSYNSNECSNKSKTKESVECANHEKKGAYGSNNDLTDSPNSGNGGKEDDSSNSGTCESTSSESNDSSNNSSNGTNSDTPNNSASKSTGSKKLPDSVASDITTSEEDVQELSRPFQSTDSLQQEGERILTYINWPHEFVKPKDLAAAGLFYLHTKDLCACAFCHGILGEWQKDDIPYKEHKKHFSHCPFMAQFDLSDNSQKSSNPRGQSVKLDHSPTVPEQNQRTLLAASSNIKSTMFPRRNNLETDVCGRRASDMQCSTSCSPIPDVVPNLSDLGLANHRGPLAKNFITINCRISSYKKWPEKISQTPKALAEAGFYSINLSDHVVCFHCGGGLRNWRAAADPWTEHSKHYPQCNFVLLCNKDDTMPKTEVKDLPESSISEIKSLKPTGDVPNDERFTNSNAHLCKICLDVPLEVLFLPCRHLATCPSCAATQSQCPVCKTNIEHALKIKIP